MMTLTDLTAILPSVVLAVATMGLMLLTSFYRHRLLTTTITILALAIAFTLLPISASVGTHQVAPLLRVDTFTLLYTGIVIACAGTVALLACGYLNKRQENCEEFDMLLLLATIGAVVLLSSNHFIAFFLGLEILSVALYGLISYRRADQRSLEAGFKYLILAAAAAAFLLFGMALLYAELGTMNFAAIARLRDSAQAAPSLLWPIGIILIMAGVGFKLALVPFQLWTPDVYEGAPAPVTAFVATVSKGAVFGVLLRAFVEFDLYTNTALLLLLALIAGASMIVGNVLALVQTNVKRVLAYSSIAHLGYTLVALLAGGPDGTRAATIYLVAYFVTTLGAFGVVTVLSTSERDAERLDDYRGLFQRRPWLAHIFAAMLLSLAGMPPLAGFIGKFSIVAAGVNESLWVLVVLVIITSAIALYYYLRIIVAMYMQAPAPSAAQAPEGRLSLLDLSTLAVLTMLLIAVGLYPTPLITFIQTMAGAAF
jgi:NADH-quinone oxidoreductase subunit N